MEMVKVTDHADGTTLITIDRPARKNAICAVTAVELQRAFAEFDRSDTQRVAVLTGNGSLYGGPFPFFRKADNHDSKLDVLVYKEAGYRLVLDSLRGLALGGIDLMDSVGYFQTESFTVEADREVPVEVDGELAGRFTKIHFVETANHLRVLAPEIHDNGGLAVTFKSLLAWPRRQPEPVTTRST